jgi:peptidoglycan/LPS O-acetylase OafA/YrhL
MNQPDNPVIPVIDERHQNNFDFLRFIGAFLVILAHCFSLTTGSTPTFGGVGLGLLGVYIFFIISGYLIAKSWDRNRSIIKFFYNRLLRLVPALAGACIFTIFIIGPLVTILPLSDYLTNFNTYSYLSTISIVIQQRTLPGVFGGAEVNGQLWTLSYELYCYIFLAVLGILGVLYKRYALFIIILISFIVVLFYNIRYQTEWIWDFKFVFANFLVMFFSGSSYYLYIGKKNFNEKILTIGAIITVIFFFLGLFQYILFITLPYFVLYLAFLPVPALNRFGNSGDYSYGLYIYGYPIQKTIVYYLGNLPIFEMIIVSLICIFPMAYLSWHCIEKRALSLKKIAIDQYFKSIWKFS